MSEEYKRRWSDRRDGRWVRDVSGLTTLMMHIMPSRTEAEVYLNEKLDVTDLMAYLARENEKHPDYRTTIFHALITIVARILRERPKMNRFVQGRRMYERNEISLSFMAKRRFADNAEEAFMYLVPKDEDTLASVSYEIAGKVHEARKSEHSAGGFDSTVDAFAKIPRLLFKLLAEFPCLLLKLLAKLFSLLFKLLTKLLRLLAKILSLPFPVFRLLIPVFALLFPVFALRLLVAACLAFRLRAKLL